MLLLSPSFVSVSFSFCFILSFRGFEIGANRANKINEDHLVRTFCPFSYGSSRKRCQGTTASKEIINMYLMSVQDQQLRCETKQRFTSRLLFIDERRQAQSEVE